VCVAPHTGTVRVVTLRVRSVRMRPAETRPRYSKRRIWWRHPNLDNAERVCIAGAEEGPRWGTKDPRVPGVESGGLPPEPSALLLSRRRTRSLSGSARRQEGKGADALLHRPPRGSGARGARREPSHAPPHPHRTPRRVSRVDFTPIASPWVGASVDRRRVMRAPSKGDPLPGPGRGLLGDGERQAWGARGG
jgi:hypothetical protein